jgi:hypothetical protein
MVNPLSKTHQTDALLRVLDARRERTTRFFLELCQRTSLPEMLGPGRSWAIIGGAVRDRLLDVSDGAEPEGRSERALDLWPDLDIAVADDVWQLPVVTQARKGGRTEIARNSFGGVKVHESALGTIDLWRWDVVYSEHAIDGWLDKLARVDFGLNAVCFAWPQAQVLIHPRWVHDLEARIVEKLSAESPRREVQVVRAIALEMKIQALLGERVTLGSDIRQDLRWLVTDATRVEVLKALRYLLEKSRTTRWPENTFQKLIAAAAPYRPSSQFREAVSAASSRRLGASATAQRKRSPSRPKNRQASSTRTERSHQGNHRR